MSAGEQESASELGWVPGLPLDAESTGAIYRRSLHCVK